MSLFYNKVCELVSLLGDLVDIQSLTDTDILQVHTIFLEVVSQSQTGIEPMTFGTPVGCSNH